MKGGAKVIAILNEVLKAELTLSEQALALLESNYCWVLQPGMWLGTAAEYRG
jgi:hypothetical protein